MFSCILFPSGFFHTLPRLLIGLLFVVSLKRNLHWQQICHVTTRQFRKGRIICPTTTTPTVLLSDCQNCSTFNTKLSSLSLFTMFTKFFTASYKSYSLHSTRIDFYFLKFNNEFNNRVASSNAELESAVSKTLPLLNLSCVKSWYINTR